MRYDFRNKTAVITGASSGIGKAIAFTLIKKYSCTVIAVARNEERLLNAKEELGDLKDKYIVRPFDASSKENWLNLAEDLINTDTSLDILINCAGILPKFKSGEDSDEVERVFDINFFSQVYSVTALLPLLKKSKRGAIINVASAAALCPFGGIASYAASKSASERYTAALACESKMFVSCILPGFVKTDIMKNQGASEKEAKLFYKMCADLDKTVKKIMRRLRRGKSRIIVGADARMMNFLFKLFPKRAPKIITWFLRKTKLEIFKEI